MFLNCLLCFMGTLSHNYLPYCAAFLCLYLVFAFLLSPLLRLIMKVTPTTIAQTVTSSLPTFYVVRYLLQ